MQSKKMEEFYVELDARRVGMAAGMQIGREEGLEKGLEETAKSMLEDGVAPEVVQKYTKLSISKIMTLL